MSVRDRARAFVRRLSGGINEYGEISEETSEQEATEEAAHDAPQRYLQWYESDVERFEAEDRAMQKMGFTGRIYQDGRLVYTGLVGAHSVAVFLDHLHPLRPPTVYLLAEEADIPRGLINQDGSVDVFVGEHHWDPNSMTASVAVEWLLELLQDSQAVSGSGSEDL